MAPAGRPMTLLLDVVYLLAALVGGVPSSVWRRLRGKKSAPLAPRLGSLRGAPAGGTAP